MVGSNQERFCKLVYFPAKHELTSEVAGKSILLRLLQVRPAIIAKEHFFGSFSGH